MVARALLVAGVLMLGLVVLTLRADARDLFAPITVPVALGGGPRVVYSENGYPNGMPCEWYAYATSVGLDYCDHAGIDIDAQYETLYAVSDGVVEFAGPDVAYWPMHVDIRVDGKKYDRYLEIYGHMSQIWVVPGQEVRIGDPLGVSGTAGTGPHLHFELRTPPNKQCRFGCSVDPTKLLERGFPNASPQATPHK